MTAAKVPVRRKVSKTSVNYRKPEPRTNRRCGNCDMFHPRHHECDLVAGVIDQMMLCDRWVRR